MRVRACVAGPDRNNRIIMADLLQTFENLIEKYGGREHLIQAINSEWFSVDAPVFENKPIPTMGMTQYKKRKLEILLRQTA